MKDDLFEELLESVQEGGAIPSGVKEPSRSWVIAEPDVVTIRARYGLSQAKFASLLGISVRTLQNWEQGRRKPRGPARVLLQVAAEHPAALLDVVRKASSPVRGEAKEEVQLERLVRTGQLRPPRSVRRLKLEELDRPSDAAGRSLSALLEERAEGR